MTTNNITTFTFNGATYTKNDTTGRCSIKENGRTRRIKLQMFEHMLDEYNMENAIDRMIIDEEKYNAEHNEPVISQKNKAPYIITEKQKRFLVMTSITSQWMDGANSRIRIDMLCDDLGAEMGAMTVGAMVSTLREKGAILVHYDKNEKCKYFTFTDFGKEIVRNIGIVG